MEVHSPEPAAFPVYLRVPDLCNQFKVSVNGKVLTGQAGTYLKIEEPWAENTRITINMNLTERIVSGGGSSPHQVAFVRGPQVLALDAAVNSFTDLNRAVIDTGGKDKLKLEPNAQALPKDWAGHQAYAVTGTYADSAEVRKRASSFLFPSRMPVKEDRSTAFGLTL